jgi:hypothetical protein
MEFFYCKMQINNNNRQMRRNPKAIKIFENNGGKYVRNVECE